MKLISTIGNDTAQGIRVHSRNPDVTDEHYYNPADEFVRTSPKYAGSMLTAQGTGNICRRDKATYEDPKIKPWEAGARRQPPTPAMKSAIGDAVFMPAIWNEIQDLIKMNCYAPMFVNVNPGGRQWRPNLIGYNALSAYGSPSYYAIQMFSRNVGDELLSVMPSDTPVQGCATRDSKTGEIFIKLVNPELVPEPLNIYRKGV